MTAHLRVRTPVAKPGKTVRLDFWVCPPTPDSLDPEKVMFTTVDAKGVESGFYPDGKPSNINRPAPDGSMSVGIKAPPLVGPAKVRAYQLGVIVADDSFLVKR